MAALRAPRPRRRLPIRVRATHATPHRGDRRPQPFSTTTEPLTSEDRQVAQALADIATIGILQERALADGHIVLTQLEGALQSRIAIEQAKGIVAQHNHVSVDDAFKLLRDYARNHSRPLRQTARDIIDGTLPTETLSAPTRNQPA
jgi:hypothetical protein